MHCDKAHALSTNAVKDTSYERIVNLMVRHMTPPHKDVGIVENLVRQSLVGIIESRKSDLKILVDLKVFLQNIVKAAGINFVAFLVHLFMPEFIPDGYSDLVHSKIAPLRNNEIKDRTVHERLCSYARRGLRLQ